MRNPTAAALLTLTLCCPVVGIAVEPSSDLRIRTLGLSDQQAPAMPTGVALGEFSYVTINGDGNRPELNASGQSAFFSQMRGPGIDSANDGALWFDDGDRLHIIAQEGMTAPGALDGEVFSRIYAGFPNLADDGTIVFHASVQSDGGVERDGLWRAKDGDLDLVVLEGAVLPGLPNVIADAVLRSYRVGTDGEIVYYMIAQERRPPNLVTGVYRFDGETTSEVVKSGDIAPGIGRPFTNFSDDSVSINSNGDVAFVGLTEASGLEQREDSGIWLASSGATSLLVREGSHPPGTPTGAEFRNVSISIPFRFSPVLNSSREIAFFSSVLAPPPSGQSGIWTAAESGVEAKLISGDTLVSRGVSIVAPETDLGQEAALMNDDGVIVYKARLFGDDITDENDDAIFRLAPGGRTQVVARIGDQAPDTPDGVTFRHLGDVGLGSDGTVAFAATFLDPSYPAVQSGIWLETSSGELELVVRTNDELEVLKGDLRTISSIDFDGGSGNADGRVSSFERYGNLAFHARFTDGTSGMFHYGFSAVPTPTASALAALACVWACSSPRGRASKLSRGLG